MLITKIELPAICTLYLRWQQLMAVRRVADDFMDLDVSGLHDVASRNRRTCPVARLRGGDVLLGDDVKVCHQG